MPKGTGKFGWCSTGYHSDCIVTLPVHVEVKCECECHNEQLA